MRGVVSTPAKRDHSLLRHRALVVQVQTVRLALACNERCIFCFADAERWADRPRGWGQDYANLIADDWRCELREIRRNGYEGLSISGGEPLLHRDLLLLVRYARLLGFTWVELQTNATAVNPTNARRLFRAGVCTALVSLPSHLPRVFDAITTTKGLFEHAVEGIGNLIAAGVSTTICHVICTTNYRRLPDFVDFVAERYPEVAELRFVYVQPEGRALDRKRLLPDLQNLRDPWRSAMKRCEAAGIVFSTDAQNGLPLCMMCGHEERFPWHQLVAPGEEWGNDLSSYHYAATKKVHGRRCPTCFFAEVCPGFWTDYIDQRGDDGLVPVRATPRLRTLFPEAQSTRVA